jgi:hypothetical protein
MFVIASHRKPLIIAHRLQAIHATYNPASVDDFSNFAGKGIEEAESLERCSFSFPLWRLTSAAVELAST